jgi:hypothetical protein
MRLALLLRLETSPAKDFPTEPDPRTCFCVRLPARQRGGARARSDRGRDCRAAQGLAHAALLQVLRTGLLALVLAGPVRAAPLAGDAPDSPCDRWAAVAAAEHGVPLPLMRAIARVETGLDPSGGTGDRTPWPWTVNAGGRGYWLATRDAAIGLVEARLAEGETRIDIGCFQLNLKWHGRAFASLDEMIDPARNARYAARFLASLKAELGDWSSAAAAYHSRSPSQGEAYLRRIAALVETSDPAQTGVTQLDGPGRSADPGPLARPRDAAMPQPGAAALGSLVTLDISRDAADAAPGALLWRVGP